MHHVLRSLIGDSERFMAFLRALLGGLDGMVDWARGDDANGDSAPWAGVPGDEPSSKGPFAPPPATPDAWSRCAA